MYEEGENSIVEKKKKKASKLVSVDEEIRLIQTIVDKFLEIKSLTQLESYFMQNKIASRNNIDFSASTLRTILTNPVYAPNDKHVKEYFKSKGVQIFADGDRANFDGKYGLMAYGKKDGEKDNEITNWIVSVGHHTPAIKNGATWVAVQDLLEKNKDKRYRANCKHDFLFSGILRCKECGSYMRPKIAVGERFYYICELKEKSRGKRCNSKNITGQTLDRLVIQKLQEIFVPNSLIVKELEKMSISKNEDNIDEKRAELNKKIKRNEEQIKSLVEKLKYMDVEIVDFVNDELKRLKEENEKLKNKIVQLDQNGKITQRQEIEEKQIASFVLEILNNSLRSFYDLDIKTRKDILRLLIEDMHRKW